MGLGDSTPSDKDWHQPIHVLTTIIHPHSSFFIQISSSSLMCMYTHYFPTFLNSFLFLTLFIYFILIRYILFKELILIISSLYQYMTNKFTSIILENRISRTRIWIYYQISTHNLI